MRICVHFKDGKGGGDEEVVMVVMVVMVVVVVVVVCLSIITNYEWGITNWWGCVGYRSFQQNG